MASKTRLSCQDQQVVYISITDDGGISSGILDSLHEVMQRESKPSKTQILLLAKATEEKSASVILNDLREKHPTTGHVIAENEPVRKRGPRFRLVTGNTHRLYGFEGGSYAKTSKMASFFGSHKHELNDTHHH